MKRFEVSIHVGPIAPADVERLKNAGHKVFRQGNQFRVDALSPAYGEDSVRAQAHVFVADIIRDFSLDPGGESPSYIIRDPDAYLDTRPDLIIDDARRADQPSPLGGGQGPWWRYFRDKRSGFRDD